MFEGDTSKIFHLLDCGIILVVLSNNPSAPDSCLMKPFYLATECLAAVVIPCNCWLFLLRVRAIPRYRYSRIALGICTLLWCATFTSFLLLPGIRLASPRFSPSANGCDYKTTFKIQYLSVPYVSLVAYDTAVATSVLLGLIIHTTHNPHTPLSTRVKSTILMRDLAPLYRSLLGSGYIYYVFVTKNPLKVSPPSYAYILFFAQVGHRHTHFNDSFVIVRFFPARCYCTYCHNQHRTP